MFWMNNVVIWYQKVEEWINEYKPVSYTHLTLPTIA